jgi:hypothetical protein
MHSVHVIPIACHPLGSYETPLSACLIIILVHQRWEDMVLMGYNTLQLGQ